MKTQNLSNSQIKILLELLSDQFYEGNVLKYDFDDIKCLHEFKLLLCPFAGNGPFKNMKLTKTGIRVIRRLVCQE